ncbi:MAG TPA: nucleoside triphosphate pyrophosphohydrolase [Candidatus Doudnabacteria bacterium]|nr:nucleoside triphosphate pyrophosphohydrolase [Candidatus Doudnabacteria bacterium]
MSHTTQERTFNKLVRDEIVGTLHKKGVRCEYYSLPDGQMLAALDNKLREEFEEYMQANESNKLEEIIDLIEVLTERARRMGIDKSQLEDLMTIKRMVKGGFRDNLFLVSTTEWV